MRTPWYLLLAVTWALQACQSPPSPEHAEPKKPPAGASDELPGVLQFIRASVPNVLDVYRGVTGKELMIQPEVLRIRSTITMTSTHTLRRTQAAELIERALREQAGVRCLSVDAQRIAVSVAPSGGGTQQR